MWIVPLLVGLAGSAHGAPDRVTLDPAIEVVGEPKAACVWSTGELPEGTGAREVPAGRLGLTVACAIGAERLVAEAEVTARAGAARPTIRLRPARLRVSVHRGGELAKAEIQLFRPKAPMTGAPLVVGQANQKFLVAEGVYDARVVLEGGASTRLFALKAQGPAVTQRDLDVVDAKIELVATENGRPAAALFRVYPPAGDTDVGQSESGGAPVVVSPGPYRVEVTLKDGADFRIHREEIFADSGARVRVKADFRTGRLVVGVTSDGQPIPALVQVRRPGAADYFTYFDAPGEVILSPGAYEVVARPKALPGLEEHVAAVTVKERGTAKLVIDLSAARLTVDIRQAGQRIEVDALDVLRAGGGSLQVRPNGDGEYRLWPGRYEVVARLANGDVARDGPFEVRLGEEVHRLIEFPHAILVVRALAAGGKPSPDAEIAVFRPGASKPTQTLKGGGKLVLGPGTYDVRATLGALSAWREGVRLGARETVELSIPLAAGPKPATPEGDLPEGE